MKETYDKIVSALTTASAACRVELTDNNFIDIICGYNYPEKLCNKIDKALKASGISLKDYGICADISGTIVVERTNIAGGPKKNYTKGRKWG